MAAEGPSALSESSHDESNSDPEVMLLRHEQNPQVLIKQIYSEKETGTPGILEGFVKTQLGTNEPTLLFQCEDQTHLSRDTTCSKCQVSECLHF